MKRLTITYLCFLTMMLIISVLIQSCTLLFPPPEGTNTAPSTNSTNENVNNYYNIQGWIESYGNNLSSQWKVYVLRTEDNSKINGSISITVPNTRATFKIDNILSTLTNVILYIFKDKNNNGILDSDEFYVKKDFQKLTNDLYLPSTILIPELHRLEGTVSGTNLTQWRAVVRVYQRNMEFYAPIGSSANFIFEDVPEDIIEGVEVGIFKDINGNGIHDYNELYVGTNVCPFTNNVTNLSFVIPEVTNYTITVNISNNVYGLKIGVAIVTFLGGGGQLFSIVSSDSTNAVNFQVTLNVPAVGTSTFGLGFIYYDLNGDGILNLTNFRGRWPLEPCFLVKENFVLGGNASESIELVPHYISGTVTGDTNGFTKVVIVDPLEGRPLVGPTIAAAGAIVSNGSYEMKFYAPYTNISTNFSLVIYNDVDNNGYLDDMFGLDKAVVWYNGTSNVVIDLSGPSTNTYNFIIKNVRINCTLSVEDPSGWYFVPLRGIVSHDYYTSPFEENVFFDANVPYTNYVIFFHDENIDHIFNSSIREEEYYNYYDTYGVWANILSSSSESVINKNIGLTTLRLGVSISNGYALTNYTNWGIGWYCQQADNTIVQGMRKNPADYISFDVFTLSEVPSGWIGIYEDTNNNGINFILKEGLLSDPAIATNDPGGGTAFFSEIYTNFTFWITN